MSGIKQPSPVRKRILWIAKLCVTLGLGWFLIAQADWSAVSVMLYRIPFGVLLGAFIIMLLSVTISAYEWQILLKQAARCEFQFFEAAPVLLHCRIF